MNMYFDNAGDVICVMTDSMDHARRIDDLISYLVNGADFKGLSMSEASRKAGKLANITRFDLRTNPAIKWS